MAEQLEGALEPGEGFICESDRFGELPTMVTEVRFFGIAGLLAATPRRLLYRSSDVRKPVTAITWREIVSLRTRRRIFGQEFLEVVDDRGHTFRWGMAPIDTPKVLRALWLCSKLSAGQSRD